MGKLENKVTIITGAGSGMGAATAELFAKEGAIVCLLDFNEESGRKKEKTLLDAGYNADFYQADITDRSRVAEIFKQIYDKYQKIDVLANIAGCMKEHGMADEGSLENEKIARLVMEVNVFGTNNCSAEVIKYFRKSGGGSIVNIGSLSAFMAYPGDWAYMTSKAGVLGLTRGYAVSYASENIRCNSVLPSVVLTEGAIKETNGKTDDMPNPMGISITANDIANTILFFASEDSNAITGQWITVDAGFSTAFPDPY